MRSSETSPNYWTVLDILRFELPPLTFPFWIWAANRVGHNVLSLTPEPGAVMLEDHSIMTFAGLFDAAGATVLGFLLFATLLPPLGYFITKWTWRLAMGRRRKKRLTRAARLRALNAPSCDGADT